MAEKKPDSLSSGDISLRFIELCQFRRLGKIRLEVDKKTTILVGANNSGKTSVLAAIRHFLADQSSFGAFDISISQWPELRALGRNWEALTEDPLTVAGAEGLWEKQLQIILAAMPTLDLWFDAEPGMYHYVAPFLSKLSWKGGAVGVRLRLEPAASIDDLKQLAWAYNNARLPVKDMGADSLAWPIDLLDFWLREPSKLGHVRVYKLSADNNPVTSPATYATQTLSEDANPIERKHLSRLIRVDFVAAQRGLGSEEAGSRSVSGPHRVGMFSNQLLKFAQQHLNVSSTGHGHRADLIQAVAEAQRDLDEKIHDAIADSVEEVRELGYPGLHDPQEIRFRTRIQTADLLDHGTAVQYSMQKDSLEELLPEHSIGLGYQNLQSLSYQLVSFKAARLQPEKGSPEPIHLVMIEEPEAHLHVQVQRIFPDKAHKLISPLKSVSGLKSQLLISTHSSHLAHSENFDRLRYVRRIAKSATNSFPATEVVNLGQVFGDDKKTRQFAERYFRVQHTDLLFANAAVFVEGSAERMLVPLFIERDFKALRSRYVSFLDIGGSHAHRLKPLVEKLRIPTVIITDIDPSKEKEGKPKKNGEPSKRLMAVANTGQGGLHCGNQTLREWHPKLEQLNDFKNPTEAQLVWSEVADCLVRFAWQLPVEEADGSWPSTFEDSLVLTNLHWFKNLMDEKLDEDGEEIEAPKGALGSVSKRVAKAESTPELLVALHALMHGSFDKGEFAASIFEMISSDEPVVAPKYITDALTWLEQQLCSGQVKLATAL
ncbi:AAA family ATPase [Halomonas colorata]|uniref:AAA family ATPase n=1 Tax=Halomonas colorata TaxID=2742615 RepID=UPI0018673659|nr:AAA family ATPase [Halomonas colorata]